MSEELSILLVESRAVTRNRARLERDARVAERAVITAAGAFESLIDDHGYQSGGPVTINSADARLLMDTITQLMDAVTALRATAPTEATP
jgi:hypothetical protein